MIRALCAALICITGCAGVEDASPAPVGRTREAVLVFLDGGALVRGNGPFAHLGAVIASCPAGGYVAGAPGDDSVWLSPVRKRLSPLRPFVGEVVPFPVACVGSSGSLRALVGGPTGGFSLFPDAGSFQVIGTRVDALDSAPGVWLAVSNSAAANVSLYAVTSTSLTNASFTTPTQSPGFGASLAWNQGGALLVGNSQTRTLGLWLPDTTRDGGALLNSAIPLPDPDSSVAGTDFGAAVVTGNVTPGLGEETVVSAPALGRVYVFSGTAVVMTLRGSPSFGASLAIDPRDAGGGLHAIWVGEPLADRVYRFVGDQGERFDAPPGVSGAAFGSAIAVDGQGVIAVGAPLFTESPIVECGAVFEATVDAGELLGVAMTCDAGFSCTLPTGCTRGICVGQVFCQRTLPVGSGCLSGQTCMANFCVDGGVGDAGLADAGFADAGFSDAGFSDAGFSDAGFSDAGFADAGFADAGFADAGFADAGFADAGVRDAGVEDAGVRDGGSADAGAADGGGVGPPVGNEVFRTCGCTSGGLPVLLLALGLLRRRRLQRPDGSAESSRVTGRA